MKIRFQGVDLTAEQVELLRNIVREAVTEYGDHPDHREIVKLHRMLLPVPMPFDPRPARFIGGHDGPRPIGLLANPGEAQVEDAWRRYDEARRG